MNIRVAAETDIIGLFSSLFISPSSPVFPCPTPIAVEKRDAATGKWICFVCIYFDVFRK